MMKLYTIKDTKSGLLLPPFLAVNDEIAKRLVGVSLEKSPELPPAQFPQDHVLIGLADFDDEDGIKNVEYRVIDTCVSILATVAAGRRAVKEAINPESIEEEKK